VTEQLLQVSVVMPVFNAAEYLEAALESVLVQTLGDLELIVVDDGSTDASPEILERATAGDARVRVVRNQGNSGIVVALNNGWRLARSRYVARMDADDVALPDRLERQVDFLDAHPEVAAVGGAVTILDARGLKGATVTYPGSSAAIRRALPRYNCFAHPAVTIRRAALEAVGGYRYDHVEDYDLWLRLDERFDLANLQEVVLLYRQHIRQISFRAVEEQARRTLAVRAAARIRRATGRDPLDSAAEISGAVLERLGVRPRDVAAAIEKEWVSWATMLDAGGETNEADAVARRAEAAGAGRVRASIAAGRDLRAARSHLRQRRIVRAAAHVVRAAIRDPALTFSRFQRYRAFRL
jgi:glycosyltransferase involved in cell wall biosynthesis